MKDSANDPVLKGALDTISKNIETKIEHDGQIELIQELFKSGFEVKDPNGARKVGSKTLQQALWRMVSKMKFLDYQIHGAGRPEIMEKVVTDGVLTVADEGGLIRSLRDKGGAFWSLALYGDGFIYVGTGDEPYPIKFSPISPSNLYVDSYATGFRSGGVGKDVTECVVIYSMSPEEAKRRYGKEFPKIKDAKGSIKRYLSLEKEHDRRFEQQTDIDNDLVEIGFYYNVSKKEYLIFAGAENLILQKLTGDKYPFVKNGEPYIPIVHLICQPAADGFWNLGLGQMLYDLAVITRKMLNMAVNHTDENVHPITLVNIPQGESAEFFNKLQLAHEMRAAGKKGIVALEYDPSNPGSSRVGADALITPSTLMSEWQLVMNRLDNELTRLGIYLDDMDRGANPTASQIIAEEESANAYVKQIMEYNSSECKFLIELVMDFTAKFVKKSNDTPLNLTTSYEEADLKGITLGALADELKKHKYFVKVNSRSGSLKSDIMQVAQLNRQLALTPPNSPAFQKLWLKSARLNDQDLGANDFAPQQAPQEGMQEPTEEAAQPIPTETDKLEVNPYEPMQKSIL
jgi:hypothetical protein